MSARGPYGTAKASLMFRVWDVVRAAGRPLTAEQIASKLNHETSRVGVACRSCAANHGALQLIADVPDAPRTRWGIVEGAAVPRDGHIERPGGPRRRAPRAAPVMTAGCELAMLMGLAPKPK